MTDEILSQAEVECLLKARETKIQEPQPASASPASASPASVIPGRTREKITAYDFKRPERVGKEQMRALQSLHEGLGRNFGAALSALLRSLVEVKLTSVDQLTYGEFVFGLENPTCFNLLTARPLEGNLILDINPSILYPVINRLLGGGKETGAVARRALTEIELRLVRRITGLFLHDLQRAWANIVPLELEVERVESNPRLVRIVPPNEVVVLISFELTLGDVCGMLNLCIPCHALERIGHKLTANDWVSYARVAPTEESIQQVSQRLDGALVEMVATLASSRITTADLLGLRVGDIVTTEQDIGGPLEISIEGVAKFHGSPGTIKGQKAIQIV